MTTAVVNSLKLDMSLLRRDCISTNYNNYINNLFKNKDIFITNYRVIIYQKH